MRTLTRPSYFWLALMPTIAFAVTAPTPTPLSYSTTFTDPSGTQQSVSFTGTASGTSLTGTLTVNGAPEQLTATIGKYGSVSYKHFNHDCTQYGVFEAGRAWLGACKGASTLMAVWANGRPAQA